MWNEVESGFSAWFRLKLGSCFSLWSFCFSHEPHSRRHRGGYLSVLGHICILIAPDRSGAKVDANKPAKARIAADLP
jgi:hypothetical protein